MLLWCTEIKTRIFFNFQTLMTNDLSPFSNLTTRLKSLQMHAMALAMTIMRVKTSTIRNTVKHWVGYQWTAMKAVAKKNRTLFLAGLKTSRGQIERMLNTRRHKQLTKKLVKKSNDLADRWKQLSRSFNIEDGAV